MAAWGANALRFLPPSAWLVPLAALAALLPPVTRAPEPRVRGFGDLVARRPFAATCALGLVTAGLVLLLPDRAHFVGDFLLRQGTVETSLAPAVLFPQALPLDVLLHYRVPLVLSQLHLLDAAAYGRALGALEAFALAALSIALARAFGLKGVAAAAASTGAAWTGALGLMSGYSKAFSEMALLTLAVAAFGTRVGREGKGVLALTTSCALGLALHRSALALLPAAALALVLAARDAKARARLRAPAALAGYVVLAAALAVFVPQIARTMATFDRTQHFASEDVTRAGGLLAASVRPRRLLDLVNLAWFFTPLVPLLLVNLRRAGSAPVALVLALSWGALAFVLFPAQGAFRDWDVFAPAGVALAALAAVLAASARADRVAALPLACLACAGLGLWSAHDRDGSWRRVQAFMTEPPARTPVERAKTWDYLGASWDQAGRNADAAAAFGHAAETSRSTRIYIEWSIAARKANDDALAQKVLEELTTFAPKAEYGWIQLGQVAWARRDFATAARAARALAALSPNDADVQARAQYVERVYAASRDSVR